MVLVVFVVVMDELVLVLIREGEETIESTTGFTGFSTTPPTSPVRLRSQLRWQLPPATT
jgi:hypothetical protein